MRQHSLKTTYLIHKTLVSNDLLMTKIDEANIQLLVSQMNTTFPNVVITRTSIKSERGNKDFIGDIVSFNIRVYSDKYDVGVDIADTIRFILENREFQDDSIRIENIILTGATETMSYDTFVQDMNFQCEVSHPIND